MSGQTASETTHSGFLQRRLGWPSLAGNRKLLSAAVIDSIGSGLVLTFILVYFVRTTSLSLAAVGGAVSLARLLAVPTAVTVGPLIDRFGSRRTALAGNVISAVGYAGFLVSHQVWQIVLVIWLAQVGGATYWTSSSGLVVAAASDERPRWFALLHMLRNSGLAAGGAIGAVLVGAAGADGLRIVVVANAVSYALAAFLLAVWRPLNETKPEPAAEKARESKSAAKPASQGGYRAVLRDRRYMTLIGINIVEVFSQLTLNLLLAVYIADGLHRPAWIAGVLLTINSLQVALTQTWINRWMMRFRPMRVILGATILNIAAFGVFMAVDAASMEWVVIVGLLVGIVFFNLSETTATPFREELSVSLASPELRGRYLAVYQLSWTFGQTAGPGLFALLLTEGAGWPWIFLIGLNVVVVPVLFALERMIKSPGPVPTPEELAERADADLAAETTG